MSNYKLNIDFSDEALEVLYTASQNLCITKEVAGESGKSVLWVSTLPFNHNTIEWNEDYMLYASRKEAMNGAVISKLSDAEGVNGVCLKFESAQFKEAEISDEVGANEYGVHNAMQQYSFLTFGLAQTVTVNDTKMTGRPINAVTLPYNHRAAMAPIERLKVFLAAELDNGVVITREFSTAINVEYRGNDTEKSIKYDYQKGIFVPA